MENIEKCSSCTLPIKEYKQGIQVRTDICEYCQIVEDSEVIFNTNTKQDKQV